MNNTIKKYLLVTLILFANCIKPYNPPVLQAKNSYLVVDGFINSGVNQVTTITLSRTRNLSDSVTQDDPELNASLQIVSVDGNTYALNEQGNGVYQSAALILDNTKTYQLKITTSNGNQYSSAFEACKTTPAIDSLNWKQPDDLNVYLYSHDAANNTHYYKWDYTETWQYNSPLTTPWAVSNGLIYVKTAAQQVDSCWQSDLSSDILLGSTVNLSEDRISEAEIATVKKNDAKLYYKYSILIRQRAISAEAYKYWEIVRKNSQGRGSFFDLQPGQLIGNIHSETDPTEPVIGFINCSSEAESRISIKHGQLHDWSEQGHNCDTLQVPVNTDNYLILDYPDTTFAPYYFITGGPLVLAEAKCLDCTKHGGTTERPSYW